MESASPSLGTTLSLSSFLTTRDRHPIYTTASSQSPASAPLSLLAYALGLLRCRHFTTIPTPQLLTTRLIVARSHLAGKSLLPVN